MKMRRIIGLVAVFLCLAAVWWFILPPALGGRTTLFVTRGVSMEPYIKQGDLAVLHKASRYNEGDVIAYDARSIKAVSLHRIVAVNSDGSYVVKGDNNPEQDLDNPTNSEIYGKMDHLFKDQGDLVKVLTSWPVRIVGLLLIVWSLYGAFFSRRYDEDESSTKRRGFLGRSARSKRSDFNGADVFGSGSPLRGGNEYPAGDSDYGPPTSRLRRAGSGPFSIAIMAIAVIAIVVSVIIAGPAFVKPAATSGEQKIIYSLGGTFNYTGPSKPGGELIYEGGQVQTGDPVYFSLVDNLRVDFDYNFTSMATFEGKATYNTEMVLSGTSGWKHTVVSSSEQPFDGKTLRSSTDINLNQLRDLTQQVQSLTNVGEGGYTVAVSINVNLDGTLGGQKFQEAFPVSLNFKADANILKAVGPTTSPDAVAEPGSGDDKPAVLDGITPSKSGTLDVPRGTDNTVTIAGHKMTVSELRKYGYSGILGGLVLFFIGANLRGRRPEAELEDISHEALLHYASLNNNRPEPSAEERFGVKPETGTTTGADANGEKS